jgi:hypothetical protein
VLGCPQQRQESMDDANRTEDVDLKPLDGSLRREVLRSDSRRGSARVVDQDIEMVVLVAHLDGRRLHAVVVGRVDLDVRPAELAGGTLAAPSVASAD